MSDTNDSRRIRQVYAAALQRDPEEWEAYLDHACADAPELRARVAALLAMHARDLLDTPTAATQPAPPGNGPGHAEGETIGPYIIRREVGRGGMGIVYLADDTRLSRRVALKALGSDAARDPGHRERLRREARAAATLCHPGIATVYAIEEIEGQLFIACEYVPGEPLRAMLKTGPLPVDQVVDIGVQLAKALSAAHTAGVIHRDIKPENIIRTPSGVVKVLDFGLAKIEASPQLSQTGVIVGTPAYLSPEQALGRQVDFRTDLFSLGLVLYELASGTNPFAASTITATLARITEDAPVPLTRIRPDTIPELERIVEICLQKDPLARYSSTEELVADLTEVAAQLAERRRLSSPARGTRVPLPKRSQPRWWWLFHQAVVSVVYVMMLYPAWIAHRWLPSPWGRPFFLVLMAVTAAATALRLHLWFMGSFFPDDVQAQQASSRLRTACCDVAFAACLLAAAFAIAANHPEFAVLLVAVSTSTLIAAFVIEPATARLAFPPSAPTSSGSYRG